MKYGKFVGAVYIINVVVQSFFSLACPMLLGVFGSWLLVEKAGAPTFIYAILTVLGALIGLYSMIRFILTTMAAVERLDAQREEKEAALKAKNKNKEDGKNEKKF